MSQELKNIASKLKSFPSMPGAAVKLLGLINDPEIDVNKIEKEAVKLGAVDEIVPLPRIPQTI
jgi:HD-like signal output (HDOD) protein